MGAHGNHRGTAWILLLAAWTVLVLALPVPAESPRRHPKLFPPERAHILDRPERDAWQKPEAILDRLKIRRGMRVADVGAGSGYLTVRLSRRVGPSGVVYAVDVQPEMIAIVREKVKRLGLDNVRPVLSRDTDTTLPPASVDVVILLNTYHEVLDPEGLLKHLRGILAPGGRLGIIDWKKAPTPFGPPQWHRIPARDVVRTARKAGFRLRETAEILEYQYFLIFTPEP